MFSDNIIFDLLGEDMLYGSIEQVMMFSSSSRGYLGLGLGILCLVVSVLLMSNFPRKIERGSVAHPGFVEKYYVPEDDQKGLFLPDLYDLTLVIPAFNEQERLPVMLDETLAFLRQEDRLAKTEILVVDDGSSDQTADLVVDKYSGSHDNIKVLKLKRNKGKGFAVKTGALESRGRQILMVDADGATKFSELKNLEKEVENGADAVFGSRNHLVKEAKAKRTFLRNFLMHGFHFIVTMLIGDQVKDTQCGFKLFTRAAAQSVFPNLHINRWGFDIEMLVLLQLQGFTVSEQAVEWNEIPGSKLSVASATVSMLLDILQVRVFYSLGIWKVQNSDTAFKKND